MIYLRAIGTLSVFTGVIALSACGPASEQQGGVEMSSPVDVVMVKTEPLELVSELPGRIEPVRVAEVRARVAGIVIKKRFEEGADVKAGDLLFQIDPAPFKAAVSRAEGNLARAQAGLTQAQVRLKRYEPLVEIDAGGRQDYDKAYADMQGAKAAALWARSELETARLNLGNTSVAAPISGRVGHALVTEGARVGKGEATLMVRIEQLDPIYVDFTQTAADALRLKEALKAGSLVPGEAEALRVHVEGTLYERRGSLRFTDAAVDPNTGQITQRGKFTNPDRVLLPGMYVRVSTPQGMDCQAILIPQRAVKHANDGSANVMVVGAGDRAERRDVTTGVMQGSRWQITDGLRPGDQVIVSSLAPVQPGSKITPKPAQQTQQQDQSQAGSGGPAKTKHSGMKQGVSDV